MKFVADCAFRSITKQLHQAVPEMSNNAGATYSLSVCYSVNKVTLALRQMSTECWSLMKNLLSLSEMGIQIFYLEILSNLDVRDFVTMNWGTLV